MNVQSEKRRNDFINSDAGIEVIGLLEMMITDTSYNTEPSYTSNLELYPDNRMPFLDKHINFLCSHPEINPQLYLSNLRLMSKVRI